MKFVGGHRLAVGKRGRIVGTGSRDVDGVFCGRRLNIVPVGFERRNVVVCVVLPINSGPAYLALPASATKDAKVRFVNKCKGNIYMYYQAKVALRTRLL